MDGVDRGTKYGISQSDLYQMISYAMKRGIGEVLLIYPGCGLIGSSRRCLTVNNALGQTPIRITACQIPMDSTGRRDIAETVTQALFAFQE